jgi:hypothetical protein
VTSQTTFLFRSGYPRFTGEATPFYLFCPQTPKKVRNLIPGVKLLVVLRDPVARAYSHYQHNRRYGREELAFVDAIQAEPARLEGEEERMQIDEAYKAIAYQRYSYVKRGNYAEQLRRWFQHFPRDQFLILRSEDLSVDPSTTMKKVHKFLGIQALEAAAFRTENPGRYEPMDESTERMLKSLFAPRNAELEELLGRNMGW